MSAAATVSFRAPMLAWAVAVEDETRFKRILQRVVGTAAIACLAFSLMPRPQEDRAKPAELPPRLAKLVLEREPLVAPKPAPEAQRLAKANIPQESLPAKADPSLALKRERTKEAPVPEARQPQPNKPPVEIEGARRQAAGVSLLAMKDTVADMRGAAVAVQLKQDIKAGPGVGTGAGVGVGAGTEPGLPARALITSNLTGGSGGINTASYSRNTGGGGLAGRSTTLVEGMAEGGGDAVGVGGVLKKGGNGKASRSIEEIRLIFERNKGAIYTLYNRAFARGAWPAGQGGRRTEDLPGGRGHRRLRGLDGAEDPELEQKLIARIRQFNFGSKDVDVMVVSWPVDFLPS